jgi:UrcA family protein
MLASKRFATHAVGTAAVLALTVVSSVPVAAKEVTVRRHILGEDQLTEVVSYADLDLASADGVKRLNSRVGGAVRHVCSPLDGRDTIGSYGACKSYAWNGARPQMDLAIQRAQQVAQNGVSAIAPVAILITVPQR